jgi:hypothetical protein
MKDRTKFCTICATPYEARNAWHRYCSRKCRTENDRNQAGRKIDSGRFCKQCGSKFFPAYMTGNNKQHCSSECAVKSARESRSKFWGKQPDAKKKMAEYYQRSRERIGPDGNLKRFYSRHPDAPHACQSCGETRVLDVAHRPGFERNGAWRSKDNTTLEKVWVLCPTCHALLDRMHYPPEELGLS